MTQSKPPKVPDFRVSLEETSTLTPLEQFELAKKAREVEAVRVNGLIGTVPRDEQDPNVQVYAAFPDLRRSRHSVCF